MVKAAHTRRRSWTCPLCDKELFIEGSGSHRRMHERKAGVEKGGFAELVRATFRSIPQKGQGHRGKTQVAAARAGTTQRPGMAGGADASAPPAPRPRGLFSLAEAVFVGLGIGVSLFLGERLMRPSEPPKQISSPFPKLDFFRVDRHKEEDDENGDDPEGA